jgi:tetratricopeptide (TPR) repeat protein
MKKFRTQNAKLGLTLAVAAVLGAIGFNLDVPANWLYTAGRADLAKPCYQLMTAFASDLKMRNERTAEALSRLADCYAASGDLDSAIKVEQQAINTYKESAGQETTPVFLGVAKLGGFLNQQGSYARAEMILNDAVQGLERAQVPDTEAVANVYAALADTYSAQAKNAQAIAVLEKLLPIDERLMMQKQMSVNSYDALAAIYAREGRVNLSRQTIEAGIRLKERILGANSVQVAQSQKKLAELVSAEK